MTIRCGLIVLIFFGMAAIAVAKPRDVILTTDCGTEIDDQWATIYLALSPQIRLLGVVSTHAPNIPNSEFSATCVRDVYRRLHIESAPPVYAGSNLALDDRTPLRNGGVDFIVSTSRSYSQHNRLVILTIGATTDVASAFLEDPKLSDRVEVVTMGFNSWPLGTDPWNIKNDPLAYKVILESHAPITIGSADTCRAHLKLSLKTVQDMFGDRGEIGKWMVKLFQDWVTNNADFVSRDVGPQQWVIWDVIVVTDLLGYAQTATYPRPELNTVDLHFSFPKTDETVNWITDVQEKPMWADFLRKIDEHNEMLSKPH